MLLSLWSTFNRVMRVWLGRAVMLLKGGTDEWRGERCVVAAGEYDRVRYDVVFYSLGLGL